MISTITEHVIKQWRCFYEYTRERQRQIRTKVKNDGESARDACHAGRGCSTGKGYQGEVGKGIGATVSNKFLFIGGPWDGQRRLVQPGTDEVSVMKPQSVVSIKPGTKVPDHPDKFCIYERECVEGGGMEFFIPREQSISKTLKKLIIDYYPSSK